LTWGSPIHVANLSILRAYGYYRNGANGEKLVEGLYCFRFGGFSMIREGVPHHIVGLGLMKLYADGTLIGRQTSSITRLQPPNPVLLKAAFRLRGLYKISDVDMGEASIEFASVFPMQILVGRFRITPAGSDKYWMISTGAMVTSSKDQYANEVVSGEIEKLGPLPPTEPAQPLRWGRRTNPLELASLLKTHSGRRA
jgi:hypothetical protein